MVGSKSLQRIEFPSEMLKSHSIAKIENSRAEQRENVEDPCDIMHYDTKKRTEVYTNKIDKILENLDLESRLAKYETHDGMPILHYFSNKMYRQ